MFDLEWILQFNAVRLRVGCQYLAYIGWTFGEGVGTGCIFGYCSGCRIVGILEKCSVSGDGSATGGDGDEATGPETLEPIL